MVYCQTKHLNKWRRRQDVGGCYAAYCSSGGKLVILAFSPAAQHTNLNISNHGRRRSGSLLRLPTFFSKFSSSRNVIAQEREMRAVQRTQRAELRAYQRQKQRQAWQNRRGTQTHDDGATNRPRPFWLTASSAFSKSLRGQPTNHLDNSGPKSLRGQPTNRRDIDQSGTGGNAVDEPWRGGVAKMTQPSALEGG